MTVRFGAPPNRIGVCIAVSDPQLAHRMLSLLSGDSRLEVFLDLEDSRGPDVILADTVQVPPGLSIVIDCDQAQHPIGGHVRAVLPPNVDGELLRAAIRVVSAGFTILGSNDTEVSNGAWVPDHSAAPDRGVAMLTARETQVLALLARGASNKLVARELDISVHTVKFHVASVLAKLGARNRSDAVAIGIRHGLILL
jgi:DNA-binding CsgD family transcriptional regulator